MGLRSSRRWGMLQVADLRSARSRLNTQRLYSLLSGRRNHNTDSQDMRGTGKLRHIQPVPEGGAVTSPILVAKQRDRAAAMQRLFSTWMATDPNYDQKTW